MWKIVFLLFITSNIFAQSSNEIRWCIEKYEQNKLLKQIIENKDSILNNNGTQIKLTNLVIKDYQKDSVTYNGIIQDKDKIIANTEQKVKDIKKVNFNKKLQNILLKVAVITLIVIDINKK